LQNTDSDWKWLVSQAKTNELQNKLGFLTSLARWVAEASGLLQTTKQLKEREAMLERARLLREETLCHDSLTQAERTWLRSNRSKEAEYWNLLTDLSPEHLRHINWNPEPETMVPDVPPQQGDEI